MSREVSVELLGWDKGPLCRSSSHRISWMGLQLCWTNIYTVSRDWNILTRGDKNRQGDWKVRYTCTTVLLHLRIYQWIIHWSKLRKYNHARGSVRVRDFFFGADRGVNLEWYFYIKYWDYSNAWKVFVLEIYNSGYLLLYFFRYYLALLNYWIEYWIIETLISG